jgi:hypothetical protein
MLEAVNDKGLASFLVRDEKLSQKRGRTYKDCRRVYGGEGHAEGRHGGFTLSILQL